MLDISEAFLLVVKGVSSLTKMPFIDNTCSLLEDTTTKENNANKTL